MYGYGSAPRHLLSEDRQEYERILDDVLRSAPERPELAGVGQWLYPELLRPMVLNATALITVAAASEYQHYVKIRNELRHPAPSTPSSFHEPGSTEPGTGTMGLVASMGEASETTGAGVGAVAAVLTPVLTGMASAIFLLVGYLLKMVDPDPGIAKTIVTTGWVFGAVTAAAILAAVVGLLLTALRNPPALDAGPYDDLDLTKEVARAKDAWHDALVERGIMPFLRDALAPDSTSPDFGGPE
ncbi:hypothetical protein [Streptomyces sp. NBC_00162]|uniref:hypothetical protein n=1 Tax=Streptomyces sp. NBC_00162 TaxID=2903629 RepID=UPI003A4C5F94